MIFRTYVEMIYTMHDLLAHGRSTMGELLHGLETLQQWSQTDPGLTPEDRTIIASAFVTEVYLYEHSHGATVWGKS